MLFYLCYISVSLFCLFNESLYFEVPFGICIYTSNFYMYSYLFFYLIHNVKLFICYVHVNLHNGAGPFHLLVPYV